MNWEDIDKVDCANHLCDWWIFRFGYAASDEFKSKLKLCPYCRNTAIVPIPLSEIL